MGVLALGVVTALSFGGPIDVDEILTAISIPKHTGWAAHYEKFNLTAQSWSVVAVAAALQVSGGQGSGGTIAQARIALTNMASVPLRATAVEQALVGRSADAATIREAAARAAEGTAPISDGDADADFRSHLAQVLTGRAVTAAAGI